MKLHQPDRKSCGAAALVMAKRLMDPDYARAHREQKVFGREVQRLHRQITSMLDTGGGLQLPWLRAIGTPPWAAAREMRIMTGHDYAVHPSRRDSTTWRWVQEATPQRPVIVYVGDRWCPRHVVLAVERVDDAAWTYEPAAGHMVRVTRERWDKGPVNLAGWNQPWFVVAPS